MKSPEAACCLIHDRQHHDAVHITTVCALAVVLMATPVNASVRTWTGASNALWSNPGNWDTGAPLPGDDVVFPATAANKSNTNDLSGLSLVNLTFQTNGYTIGGNTLAITNAIV